MRSSKRTVYVVSPHLDDATWSLGGLISTRKDWAVVIINVFSHSLFIDDRLDSPVNATRRRMAEDLIAAKHCGVSKVINLEYSEAVLRGIPLSELINPAYVPPVYLLDVISRQLNEIIPEQAVVLFPAGFGNNVDHVMARDCNRYMLNRRVRFYEDMPYAARDVNVEEAQKFLSAKGYQRHKYTVNESTIQTHMDLYDMYKTQRKQHHTGQIMNHLKVKGYGIWMPQI